MKKTNAHTPPKKSRRTSDKRLVLPVNDWINSSITAVKSIKNNGIKSHGVKIFFDIVSVITESSRPSRKYSAKCAVFLTINCSFSVESRPAGSIIGRSHSITEALSAIDISPDCSEFENMNIAVAAASTIRIINIIAFLFILTIRHDVLNHILNFITYKFIISSHCRDVKIDRVSKFKKIVKILSTATFDIEKKCFICYNKANTVTQKYILKHNKQENKMRQRSYARASSRASSSYYSENERRGRKAVNFLFAVIALIAITVVVILFFKYRDISIKREDAASRLEIAKSETERLNNERRAMNTELENLSSELDMLKIEYESLSE